MWYKNPGRWLARRRLPADGDSEPRPALGLALLVMGAFLALAAAERALRLWEL